MNKQQAAANSKSKAVAHGDGRMICMKVRYFTNGIADTEGHILPKHMWDAGVVFFQENDKHGVRRGRHKHFHSLAELPKIIEDLILDEGITVHSGKRTRNYRA